MKRGLILAGFLAAVLAGDVMAAGHYELVWFRMWDKSENSGCAGINSLEVWVFDEYGNRKGNVAIRNQDGNCLPGQYGDLACYSTGAPPESKQAQIGLWPGNAPYGVKCVDGSGSTSDVTPMMTTAMLPCWGHYSYEAGFIFKADGATPGDADDTLIGDLGQPGDTFGTYTAAYTSSMVYASQDETDYDTADPWVLHGLSGGGKRHSQTFVATGINRVTTVFGFPVQPANGSTVWRASIQVGGPNGPTICESTSPFDLYFGNPLGFDVDECPVTPGETYAYTMEPLSPSTSNVYTYQNNNYPGGAYYKDGVLVDPDWDMFGFVAGWDSGADTVGYIAGKVKDTNGDPLEAALVTLLDAAGVVTIETTTTGHTGSFVFRTVSPGTYTVKAEIAGFSEGLEGGQAVTAAQYTLVEFTLAPDLQELTNWSFEMGSLYAWQTYGDGTMDVWPDPVGDVNTPGGTYYLGVVDVVSGGGVYQRVRTLPGEQFEAVFNMKRQWGTASARIGIDVDGGTDPAGVDYWSPWSVTAGSWSNDGDPNKRVAFTSTGEYTTVFLDVSATGDAGFVCFDNIRLFRKTGPNYAQQGTFDGGWALASAPLLPSGSGAPISSAFDGLIAAGNNLTGKVHSYSTGGGTYSTVSNVTQGTGYWMDLSVGGTENIAGPLPLDPVGRALGVGWHLIGQPHRYGTPVAGLVFSGGGPTPAWRDNIISDKRKYRSDGPWTWQTNGETVVVWRVLIVDHGYSDRYPRIRFRESKELDFSYDSREGWWELPGGNATVGGVNIAGADRVLMTPGEWHTVRAYHDHRGAQIAWSIMIDGKTDSAHYAEGTYPKGTDTNNYLQWGVLSSGKSGEFYTNYIAWGQNAEIDNWPAGKIYDASGAQYGMDPGVNPGWGTEGSGTGFSAAGAEKKSFAEAVEAGWVEGAVVGYDDGYRIVRPAGGDGNSLDAWYGYWLNVLQSGLTLQIPGPAYAPVEADDTVSTAKLILDADGCISSNFAVRLSPSATDGYEADQDVSAPPAGPASQKEVSFGTTVSATLLLSDARDEPAPAATKVWAGTMQPVNFAALECQDVTVSWDVSGQGAYGYKLVDVDASVETTMAVGGSYVFELCDGDDLPFEIHTKEGGFGVSATITGWSSIRSHTGHGDLEIALNASDAAAATTEPRRDGVQRIAVDFDTDVTSAYTAGQVVATGGLTVSGESLVSGGTRLLIDVTGSTNGGCYSLDVSGSVAGLTGDADCRVASLEGDSNGDQNANFIDVSQVKSLTGQPATSYIRADYNTDGDINFIDVSAVKSLVGASVSCP